MCYYKLRSEINRDTQLSAVMSLMSLKESVLIHIYIYLLILAHREVCQWLQRAFVRSDCASRKCGAPQCGGVSVCLSRRA